MRIRSIRPEFWRSEDVAALSRENRLLFIGLWQYVDDNGVGIDDHRLIAADLFPLEEDQKEVREFVRDGLATLSRALLVIRYTIAGRRYVYIPTWDRHQKVDRPAKARYPRPPDDLPPPTSGNPPEDRPLDGDSRQSRDSLAPGEGEKGRRGEGESACVDDVSPERDPAHDDAHARRDAEVWTIINGWRVGHRPPYQRATYRALAKHVTDLLAGGADSRLIADALRRWDERDNAAPGLLPHLYDDAVRATRPKAEPVATTDKRMAEAQALKAQFRGPNGLRALPGGSA